MILLGFLPPTSISVDCGWYGIFGRFALFSVINFIYKLLIVSFSAQSHLVLTSLNLDVIFKH